ncbi:MAG: PAS domain S-box protein [Zetaproteobacteria bacterium]|nr:MAG: PAS domain S-box protein [Zetaproteobacteria bacterium]
MWLGLLMPCLAHAGALQQVRIQLKWLHQFQFAGIYAALEQGYYRDEGLDVRILEGGPGHPPVDALLRGQAEYCIADSGALLYRAEGKPVVVLASIFQHSPQVIYTRDDIASPGQLAGRRVMMQQGYLTVEVLALLRHYGVEPGDFVRQPIGRIEDLIHGNTDAFPGYSSNEAFMLKQRGIPFRMFRPRDIGIDFYGDVLLTTEQELVRHGARAEAFRRATLKGWSYALAHLDETVDLILRRYNTQHKTRAHLLFEGRAIRALMMPDIVPIGLSNEQRWRHIADTFARFGFATEQIDWQAFLYHPSSSLLDVWRRHRAFFTVLIVIGVALLIGVYALMLKRQVRRRTRELREASAEFERILDRMQDVYYRADAAGRLQWISATVRDKLGYSRDELIGRPLAALYAEPDGRLRFLRALESNGGSIDNYLMRLRRKDGAILWAEASSQYIRDEHGQVVGIEGNVRDVTQRHRAEEAARSARAELEVIFENMQDTFYRADNEGRIRFASPSVEHLLGVPVAEVVGTSVASWYANPADRDAFLHALRKGGGSVSNYEAVLRHRDGHEVWVSVNAHYCRDERGEVRGVEGVIRDISELKRTEEEKWALMAQFQQAQRLESIALLAGGIAHDFNNLLVGVLGSAELAQLEPGVSEAVRAHLARIERSAEKGAQLVRQLLAYAGKGQLEAVRLDVNELLRETACLMTAAISKKARLVWALCEAPCHVRGDTAQLSQIVMNLITNASEALGDKPGTIRLATGVERLSRSDLLGLPPYDKQEAVAGDYVFIEVADDGCGMAPKVLEQIFDPFFTTKAEGTGLGLSALLGIVKQHGGRVRINSEVGKGSVFRIYLPQAGVEDAGAAREAVQDTSAREALHGCVLIVDDEAIVRRVAAGMLSRAGMRVLQAEHGTAALELLRQGGIDVVVLDLGMPGMGGEQVFEELRKLDPTMPVVISSGYAEAATSAALRRQPRVRFVGKPYASRRLIAAIGELLAS